MGFEVIHSKKPSYSMAAAGVIVLLSILSLCISALFAYLFVTGRGNNMVMGTMVSAEFLIAAVVVTLYLRYFLEFREVSEDREEELLW
ncbi:MAG: hypothetical protein M1491_00735 [Deltaproteobacteria bacterium]|nr:hypothetical protein [Deltaproteobacteria bacterium]MCL5277346.1 hypothetical protein [Deltaproteobacteria bacterium]